MLLLFSRRGLDQVAGAIASVPDVEGGGATVEQLGLWGRAS